MLTHKLGNFCNFFDPSEEMDKELYRWNIQVISTVYAVLNECGMNIKCRGYTFIKDAICIIIDLGSMDVCFEKDVYKPIMEKYGTKSISRVEHCIRNSISSAYKVSADSCLTNWLTDSFDKKPGNKEFILTAVQEVSARLIEEL